MNLRLRTRFFVWLLFMLAAFMVLQALIYTAVEINQWHKEPEGDLKEELMEVVVGVGSNVIVLPLLVLIAWWISERMVRPVQRIAATAEQIKAGSFHERIDTASMPHDEMRDLAEALNAAFEQYHDAVNRLKRFTGDASHQLRTPMTAMRMSGEVALIKARDPSEYRQTISNMLEGVQRLTRVVDQLLELARLDNEAVVERFKKTDASQCVTEALGMFEPICLEKRIHLTGRCYANLIVMGSEDLIIEMLANLLDNATKHTPEGGEIKVSAERGADNEVVLTVADNGPGIPHEYADKVFERFGQAPGVKNKGSGLGLSIVSDIVRVHGGRIELNSSPGKGATFRIYLKAS